MNEVSFEKVRGFFDNARLSMARAILPAVGSADDEALAHAFMQTLDDVVEAPSTQVDFAAVADSHPDTVTLFLESYPVAIVAYTRQAVEAQIQSCTDDEERESLVRFLGFLKKVGLTLAKNIH